MNKDFYIVNTMIDTSLAFEIKAKEEKVKMYLSIFAFFIVILSIVSVFFIFDLNKTYNILIISCIELIGGIICFLLEKYRRTCKSYLLIYRKELHDLFAAIFEYERFVKWENDFEKHLIKRRLILVNPNV